MRLPRHLSPAPVVRGLLVIGLAWLVVRFWHPHYGFTRFLQMDVASIEATAPELRDAPIFPYADGYDGHYYAQLAARPTVADPVLAGSIDDVGYRGRRILLSWIAWAAAGGEPVAAVRTYAWLNLVAWVGLAWLAWRLFPTGNPRSTLAWVGVLFSAGVLHNVRLALTDLLALGLVGLAVLLAERERRGWAAALLALAALTRETSLLALVVLLPKPKDGPAGWFRAGGLALLATLPLALWVLHLRAAWPASHPGLANFTVPFSGWAMKWSEIAHALRTEPDRYLALTTALAHVGLTVQVAYIVVRRDFHDRWWRLAAVFAALAASLGMAVWQGHPGAATRVLLPLTLAFNVWAIRRNASWAWLVAGNLSVLSGVLALWHVPTAPAELAAGRTAAGSYVVRGVSGWYPAETARGAQWAWCSREGRLVIDGWPRRDAIVGARISLNGITPREIEIRQGDRVLWRGSIERTARWIPLAGITLAAGRAELTVTSSAEPVDEGRTGGRRLGFAVRGLTLD